MSRARDVRQAKREGHLLESFMNNASDRFYILDEGLNIVTVNDTALKKYGFTRKEIVGRNFSDVFPSIRGTGRQETYERVIETGEPYSAVDQSDTEDQYRLYAFKIEDGMGLIVTDITEAMTYRNHLEALHSSAARLAEAKDLEEIAATALESLSKTLGHGFGEIGFVEDDRFVFYASTTREFDEKPSIPLESKSVIVRSIKTGEMQLVPDVREDPDYSIIYSRETPLLSELSYPILVDDRAVGVINVESPERDAYSQDDVRLIGTLAQHVASSIRRLEQIDRLETYQSRLEALHSSSSRLAETQSIEEISEYTIDVMEKALGFTWVGFGIVEDNLFKHKQHMRDTRTETYWEMPLDGPGITVRAIRTGETQIIADTRKDVDFVGIDMDDSTFSRLDEDIQGHIDAGKGNVSLSELDVPVKIDDSVVALLGAESKELNAFTEQDQELLETLASHVASAIHRIRTSARTETGGTFRELHEQRHGQVLYPG